MKKRGIFWGLVLICVAVLLILESIGTGLGLITGVPPLKIILGVACLAWLGSEIYKLNIAHIFFPISFIFLLFEKELASLCGFKSQNIISNWTVILIALLLTIGTALILPKKKADKMSEVFWKGHRIAGKSTKYIDTAEFVNEHVENNMGATDVYFENAENYNGGGVLNIENHMGALNIHIPKDWTVIERIDNNIGKVKVVQSYGIKSTDKTITITGECHMGTVTIDYV